MSRLVDWLAGPDAEQRRRWQLCLSNFVDAVAATAIENGCFIFAAGNPFWDQLTVEEAREVARGLAALGFRYDGMVSSRTDAYRVSTSSRWPSVRRVCSPSAFATGRGPRSGPPVPLRPGGPDRAPGREGALDHDGQLVLMLGRRAEVVADLWNDWPRARPLLLLPSRE